MVGGRRPVLPEIVGQPVPVGALSGNWQSGYPDTDQQTKLIANSRKNTSKNKS